MALTAKVREMILLSGPCAYCDEPLPTQVDHVMPVSRGGTDDRDNLVPACKWCNMEKLDFTPDEWRAWREETGRGWPPQSPSDFLRGLLADLRVKYPDVDLAEVARRFGRKSADA